MNNTKTIEAYILGSLEPEERLLMEAKLLIHSDLNEDLVWQKSTHQLVQAYGRKQVRAEIEAAHEKLFSENKFESFRNKIYSIFKK